MLAAMRVHESQFGGVEGLAPDGGESGLKRAPARGFGALETPAAASIELIRENGMATMGEMDSDLMGPSRKEAQTKKGRPSQVLLHPVVRQSGTPPCDDSLSCSVARMTGQRVLEFPLLG